MGVGMQIAYFGFAGSAALEAEAAVQLVRLDRFSALISGCHLAIESRSTGAGSRAYDVRLDLITRNNELKPLPHCASADVIEAVCCAFAQAERELIEWRAGAHKETPDGSQRAPNAMR